MQTTLEKTLSEEKKDLAKLREYKVVKANDLIQKSRFNLTMQEQKIVLYLISKIKPDDTDFAEYTFEIAEFCRVCGIDESNGKNYLNVKNAIQSLANKSMWVNTEKNSEILL